MRVELKNNNTELHYDQYVHRGSMMYLREGLSINDPDYLYNYIKRELEPLGYEPEQFNILHPILDKYKDYSKEQLLSKICALEQELTDITKYI